MLATALATLVACVALLLSSPASALDNPDYTVPPPATVVTTPPPPEPVVQTAVRREAVRTRLAITGSSTAVAAAVGAGLLALGAGAMVLRRRQAASAA